MFQVDEGKLAALQTRADLLEREIATNKDRHKAALRTAKAEGAALRKDLENARKDLHRLGIQEDAMKKEHVYLQKQNNQLLEDLKVARGEKEHLRGDVASLELQVANQSKRLDTAHSELDTWRTRHADLEAKLSKLRGDYKACYAWYQQSAARVKELEAAQPNAGTDTQLEEILSILQARKGSTVRLTLPFLLLLTCRLTLCVPSYNIKLIKYTKVNYSQEYKNNLE